MLAPIGSNLAQVLSAAGFIAVSYDHATAHNAKNDGEREGPKPFACKWRLNRNAPRILS
jgi:hypothetical protein